MNMEEIMFKTRFIVALNITVLKLENFTEGDLTRWRGRITFRHKYVGSWLLPRSSGMDGELLCARFGCTWQRTERMRLWILDAWWVTGRLSPGAVQWIAWNA